MLDVIEKRLKRLLATDGGKVMLESMERESAEKQALLDRRLAAVARIEEARRRDAEDTPAMEEAVRKADAALKAAEAQVDEARRHRSDVGMDLQHLRNRNSGGIRAAEAELRRTADPRLTEMLSDLHTASANFRHVAWRMRVVETRGELATSRNVVVNQAEIDALRARLQASLRAVERWIYLPAPDEEEIRRVLEEAAAAIKAGS